MDVLTRFERTRLISARALQISLGAPVMIKEVKGASINDLARLELDAKATPLAILREFPNGDVKRVEVM